ncbi:MAG: hypothetical protein MK096_01425 [Oleiphilaceae bacterium]|nr:hypothetical protein [Oleiphilaceae bacterium]
MKITLRKTLDSDTKPRLLTLLNLIANNEIRTHLLYSELIKRHACHVGRDQHLLSCFHTALTEDKDHYQCIEHCIELIQGPEAPTKTRNKHYPSTQLKSSFSKLLKSLYLSEASSVQAYSEICTMTLEKDYRLFDLAYRNMHENIVHLDAVEEALNTHCQHPLTH